MEGSTPQDQEPQDQNAPGEAPEGTPGDQGEPAPADPNAPTPSGGFNPDEPVRTSAPPAEEASGVPDLPGGANEGVEPGSGEPSPEGVEPGPTEGGGQSETGTHPEANQGGPEAEETGDPDAPTEPGDL